MALGSINLTGLAATTGLSLHDLLRAEVRGWVLVVKEGRHVPIKVLATAKRINRFREW